MAPKNQQNATRRPRSGAAIKSRGAGKANTQQQDVRTEIMTVLFSVFRESISREISDINYWLERMQFHNSIGSAMGDRLKELTESLSGSNEKDDEKCKDSWRAILEEQEKSLSTLIKTAESYRETTAHLLKQLD